MPPAEIEALLDGSRAQIPEEFVESLARFFSAPVADLTATDPLRAETVILRRQLRDRAGGVAA